MTGRFECVYLFAAAAALPRDIANQNEALARVRAARIAPLPTSLVVVLHVAPVLVMLNRSHRMAIALDRSLGRIEAPRGRTKLLDFFTMGLKPGSRSAWHLKTPKWQTGTQNHFICLLLKSGGSPGGSK